MAFLFDPVKSCSVAIGTSTYTDPELPPLEAALYNCTKLSHLFKRFLKIPSEQRATLLDQTQKEVFNTIQKFVNNPAIELMILYFSGHGIVSDDRKNYYLALKETEMDNLKRTSIDVRDLAEELGNRLNIIFILDSCFSEKVFEIFDTRKCFIMASCARDATSKYPPEDERSVFTDKLIEVIERGIVSEKSILTSGDVFESVKAKLQLTGCPIPHRSAVNEVDKIQLFPNNNMIEGTLESKMVYELFTSIQENCNEDIRKEIPEVIAHNNDHPEGKEIQLFILKKYPVFIASPLRRLLFNCGIINKEVMRDYKRIVHFLGLCLLADLVRADGLKNTFDKPIEYLKKSSHIGFRKLFKELLMHQPNIFISELKEKMPELEVLMDQIEQAGQNETSSDVHRLLILLIGKLSFLVNYDFLSVRLISVRKRFLEPDEFIHSVSELKGDEAKNYSSTLRFKKCYLNSSTVLIFKASSHTQIHHDDKYINLWPLIIDANTLTSRDNAPQLYFFFERDDEMQYHYRHALDENAKDLVYKDIDKELEAEELRKYFGAFELYFE